MAKNSSGAAANHIWVYVPDHYGAFDLLKTGVPHPGAIATGIRFDECTTLGEKQSNCDMFKWATDSTTLLFPDLYFVNHDNASRPHFMNEALPFLCSIKNDHFKAFTDRLRERRAWPGEWYGLHNGPPRQECIIDEEIKISSSWMDWYKSGFSICERSIISTEVIYLSGSTILMICSLQVYC